MTRTALAHGSVLAQPSLANDGTGEAMYQRVYVATTWDKRPILSAARGTLEQHSVEVATEANGENSAFNLRYYNDADVIKWVAARDFRCFCPSSSFSILELERQLDERASYSGERSGIELRSFATTPVVLMMSPAVFARLEKSGGGPIGWESLLLPNTQIGLMHAHARSADGLAVVTAAHMAAAQRKGLEDASADDKDHDRLMRAMQSVVIEYGPDDAAVVEHGLPEGRWRADVVAIQERTAYLAAARFPNLPIVVVHPHDASVWADQVIGWTTQTPPDEQETVDRLVRGLRNPGMSQVYRSQGLRLTQDRGAAQPFAGRGNVSVVGTPSPPSPMPGRRLIRTIRKRWSAQKKSADVCLVLDISGSMAGRKLTEAKNGVTIFLDQLEGRDANICLITFSETVRTRVPLQAATSGKAAADAELRSARARGGTSLLDGVAKALDVLDTSDGTENLKAIVLLTDGGENSSSTTYRQVEQRIRSGDRIFFGIAYGSDADRDVLEWLARSGSGHSLVTDENDVRAAYETLSAHL